MTTPAARLLGRTPGLGSRSGQVTALLLAVLFSVLGLMTVRLVLGESDFARCQRLVWHNRGTYLADGALQLALQAIEDGDSAVRWELDLGGESIPVELVDGPDGEEELVATAKVGDLAVVRRWVLQESVWTPPSRGGPLHGAVPRVILAEEYPRLRSGEAP